MDNRSTIREIVDTILATYRITTGDRDRLLAALRSDCTATAEDLERVRRVFNCLQKGFLTVETARETA